MIDYVLRRIVYMVVVLVIISICAFVIIQLPPGDYLTDYLARLQSRSTGIDEAMIEALRRQYGLDLPAHLQYLRWVGKMVRGDFGQSFSFEEPVSVLLMQRLPMTVLISLLSLVFVYAVSIPIGIYSATHQYSLTDYGITVIGFIGLATPNFLLALVLMLLFFQFFGLNIGGLSSIQYVDAPWSIAKFLDLLAHLPVPIVAIVLGLPTIGPLEFRSLMQQDMFLAGSTIMILSFLTVVGTLISDLLLVIVDPRIRFETVGR